MERPASECSSQGLGSAISLTGGRRLWIVVGKPLRGPASRAFAERDRNLTNARRINAKDAAMNAPLKAVGGTGDLDVTMREIGREARRASRGLALASTSQKKKALA